MAKRVCPFCKEVVNNNAVICKHCKSQLPPLPAKKWYQTWKGLLAIFFVIVAVSGVTKTKSPAPQPETPEQIAARQESRNSDEAAIYAKEYVKKSLKAPSTAKWPFIDDFAVAPKKDKQGKTIKDVWEVSSYVDSQNSYGAMIRQKWYVKMKKANGSWELLDIKFGN